MSEEIKNDPYSVFTSKLKKNKDILENIKDKNVFDLNYIPEKIYMRKEAEEIADIITEYVASGLPTNIVVYGNKGSGKTSTVLSLLNVGKKLGELDYTYIRATEYPTSFKMFGAIAGKPMHGYFLSEVAKEAFAKITGRHIVIIDDANAMKDDIILRVLPNETKAQIILLTQKASWFNSLKDDAKESLSPVHIYFNQYDVLQLKTILTMRAEMGLKSYSEDGISMIATLLYNNYGSDARVGIKALYHVGKNNDWSEEFIKMSLERAYKEVNSYILGSLDDKKVLILYALLLENNTNKAYAILEDYMKKLYGMPVVKRSQYFNIVHELSNLGLIDTIKKQEDKYYTLEVQFLIDPKLITEEFKKRFESEGG